MQKKNILISVIDGQGGGIGRQYISSLTSVLPKDLPVTIRALGTNSLATSNMLKGGANDGATGENAIGPQCRTLRYNRGCCSDRCCQFHSRRTDTCHGSGHRCQQCTSNPNTFRQLQYTHCHADQRAASGLY